MKSTDHLDDYQNWGTGMIGANTFITGVIPGMARVSFSIVGTASVPAC